jgi:hypothetical protein
MKTILALTLIAAAAAFFLFVPLSFEITVSACFAAGLVGILIADYTHAFLPLSVKISAHAPRSERFRLAA